ncbi:unnamed protein product [Lepeophtheirus salmonis]|uniref:(salmon louse) hypothetical protein n=1 Tax=Lepeophtheirus salmonis TaxID=72036 RepID=A0A7R8CFR8_LEPSM|nr:unnamed protein product [Lepeophtheirus salmonis]CAF2808959.1 unnamed protein product [Lepeophtheirus salmonis]
MSELLDLCDSIYKMNITHTSYPDKEKSILNQLEDISSFMNDEKLQFQISFFIEQILLAIKPPSNRRYSSFLLGTSSIWQRDLVQYFSFEVVPKFVEFVHEEQCSFGFSPQSIPPSFFKGRGIEKEMASGYTKSGFCSLEAFSYLSSEMNFISHFSKMS